MNTLIVLFFLLVNLAYAAVDDNDHYRVTTGERFKEMLMERNTDCFRKWIANADARCLDKEKTPNWKSLASQLVVCESERERGNASNCSDAAIANSGWKECFVQFSEKDMDNFAAFHPQIPGYCAAIKFYSGSVLDQVTGGISQTRISMDVALKNYSLTRIMVCQVIPLPSMKTEFKDGQFSFYMVTMVFWVLCKTYLKWGCENFMMQVVLAAMLELGLAFLYTTKAGLALVSYK